MTGMHPTGSPPSAASESGADMEWADERDEPEAWVIRRPPGRFDFGSLAPLIDNRELLGALLRRDIAIRYKQTFLGPIWGLLVPFVTMVLFSLIFGGLAGMPSEGLPYPLFLYAALQPWQFFSRAVTDGANSLVTNKPLVLKTFVPRLLLPFSAVLPSAVDYLLAFVILVGLCVYYGIAPEPGVLLLPVLMLWVAMLAFGLSLWTSVATAFYRDIAYITPFALQLWFFATPIVYPRSRLPEELRFLFDFNPATGIVESFRYALFGVGGVTVSGVALGLAMTAAIVVGGLYIFRRNESQLADRL